MVGSIEHAIAMLGARANTHSETQAKAAEARDLLEGMIVRVSERGTQGQHLALRSCSRP